MLVWEERAGQVGCLRKQDLVILGPEAYLFVGPLDLGVEVFRRRFVIPILEVQQRQPDIRADKIRHVGECDPGLEESEPVTEPEQVGGVEVGGVPQRQQRPSRYKCSASRRSASPSGMLLTSAIKASHHQAPKTASLRMPPGQSWRERAMSLPRRASRAFTAPGARVNSDPHQCLGRHV